MFKNYRSDIWLYGWRKSHRLQRNFRVEFIGDRAKLMRKRKQNKDPKLASL
jgi:hypothetical protein